MLAEPSPLLWNCIGRRPDVVTTGGHARSGMPDRAEMELPLNGFALTLTTESCIAVEDAVGCCAQVLAGDAWITAEGAPQDVIVAAGATVPLELGVRFNIGALRDLATVLITAPGHLYDVGFSLHRRQGMRVLTITSGISRLPAALSGTPAAIAAFARRCFAGASSTTIEKECEA